MAGLASYGVCIGTLSSFGNDGQAGHWLHGLIFLNTPSGVWRCAVDVNGTTAPVQFKVIYDIDPSLFATISRLPDGYTDLAKTSTSGAIDYVRDTRLLTPDPQMGSGLSGCLGWFVQLFADAVAAKDWTTVTGTEANDALQSLVTGSRRIFVFGEPYHDTTPVKQDGMHNIHYNQGDPPGPHQVDDAIWQDGATFVQTSDGRLCAFLNKFTTQVLTTNDQGLPA